MTLTKLKFVGGTAYQYVNLEAVEWVDTEIDRYDVYMSSGHVLAVDLTETTISDLISAADTAYGA